MSKPDIDTQIEEICKTLAWAGSYIDSGQQVVDEISVEKAHKAIKALLIQSKIDELGYIQTEYGGRFLATTFADGDGQTIEARIADLKEEL